MGRRKKRSSAPNGAASTLPYLGVNTPMQCVVSDFALAELRVLAPVHVGVAGYQVPTNPAEEAAARLRGDPIFALREQVKEAAKNGESIVWSTDTESHR